MVLRFDRAGVVAALWLGTACLRFEGFIGFRVYRVYRV